MPDSVESITKRLTERAENLDISMRLKPIQEYEEARALLNQLKAKTEKEGENFYLPSIGTQFKAMKTSDNKYLAFPVKSQVGNTTLESELLLGNSSLIEQGNSQYLAVDVKRGVGGSISFDLMYLNSAFQIPGSSKRYPVALTRTNKSIEIQCSGTVANCLEKQVTIDGKLYVVTSQFVNSGNDGVRRYELELSK